MAFVHGKTGTFAINGNLFKTEQFGFDHSCNEDEITHTGANGYQVILAGVESAEGNATFVYDTAAKPTVSPQSMKAGVTATFALKPDGSDNFTFDAVCTKFSWASGPKSGAVRCNVTFRSTGTITVPTS